MNKDLEKQALAILSAMSKEQRDAIRTALHKADQSALPMEYERVLMRKAQNYAGVQSQPSVSARPINQGGPDMHAAMTQTIERDTTPLEGGRPFSLQKSANDPDSEYLAKRAEGQSVMENLTLQRLVGYGSANGWTGARESLEKGLPFLELRKT